VFGAAGCSVARNCWCMYYRRSGSRGELPDGITHARANRAELKALVDSDQPPGLIGYNGKVPVGWISLGPREEFLKLRRSPVMKAVDETPVWSIICFVVPSRYRGQGVARAMLAGAMEYARQCGAEMLEAYPVDTARRTHDESMWFGAKSMFDDAGFVEVLRRKPRRPVMRFAVE
jgi:ribosomal protein S18 acetylase RimI-like enzyme